MNGLQLTHSSKICCSKLLALSGSVLRSTKCLRVRELTWQLLICISLAFLVGFTKYRLALLPLAKTKPHC